MIRALRTYFLALTYRDKERDRLEAAIRERRRRHGRTRELEAAARKLTRGILARGAGK